MLSPDSQGQNLALTVLYVLCLLTLAVSYVLYLLNHGARVSTALRPDPSNHAHQPVNTQTKQKTLTPENLNPYLQTNKNHVRECPNVCTSTSY